MQEEQYQTLLDAINLIGTETGQEIQKLSDNISKLSNKVDQVEQAVYEMNADREEINYMKDRLEQQDKSIWKLRKEIKLFKQSSGE